LQELAYPWHTLYFVRRREEIIEVKGESETKELIGVSITDGS